MQLRIIDDLKQGSQQAALAGSSIGWKVWVAVALIVALFMWWQAGWGI